MAGQRVLEMSFNTQLGKTQRIKVYLDKGTVLLSHRFISLRFWFIICFNILNATPIDSKQTGNFAD